MTKLRMNDLLPVDPGIFVELGRMGIGEFIISPSCDNDGGGKTRDVRRAGPPN